jgi:hypothetical protein
MYDSVHRYNLYEIGWAVAAGFNEPKQLRKLLPEKRVELPTSGPLKPSKKGKVAKTHG